MERAAGFTHDDTAQVKLDKLDALLAQTSTSTQDAALFAEMLSLPNDGRYPSARSGTRSSAGRRTLEALTAQIEALSRQNPVLMIFEDAHWADPTSLEGFGRAVDGLRTLRVLLIVTFRPEFEPPWIGQPHVTALTINRLTHRDIEAMIDHVVGNKLSSRERSPRRHRAHRRHPAICRGNDQGGARSWWAQKLPYEQPQQFRRRQLPLPASLHASLMARLDQARLPRRR